MLATKPNKIINTNKTTIETARKGIKSTIIPVAHEKDTTIKAIAKEIIASICLLSSPKILDFWRIAKIKVKTRRNG